MSLHTSIIQVAVCAVQMIREAAKALAVLNDQSKPCHSQNAVQIDCLQLQLQLEVDVAKIMSWYSLWFIETDNSDDLFRALWGHAGHSAILSVLQCIKKECEALKYAVDVLVGQLNAQVRKSKPKRTNSWKKIQKLLHLSTKGTAETHPSKEIHDDIRILTGYVDELWAKSELHFRRLHGVPRGLHNRPDTANVDGRVEHAVATRSASSALYWSLQSCATGLDLELDLLNHDQESDVFSDLFGWSDLKLSYHLQLKVPNRYGTRIDLVADLYDDDRSPGENTLDVVDDIMLVVDPKLSEHCSKFVLRCPSTSERGELSFLLRIKADVKTNVDRPIWLDTMEGTKVLSSSNGVDLGSVQAKMTLAYRVVESSLFLLGTPWFFHLNSDAIRASKIARLDQRYSLHISTSAFKSAPKSSFLQVEPAQIFQIGIILVEIALGRRILAKSPTVASNPALMNHIAAIEDTMGVPYKQACEFCLMQEGKEVWKPNAKYVANSLVSKGAPEPVEMVSLFYSEVFMRLRDVYTS